MVKDEILLLPVTPSPKLHCQPVMLVGAAEVSVNATVSGGTPPGCCSPILATPYK